MIRAVPVTLNFITKTKKRKIQALIEAYRKCVNQYLKLFEIHDPKLNKETLDLIKTTKLSQRYKSNALKQSIEIYKSCVKSKKKIPQFKGFPNLDAKFVQIQDGKNSFDLAIRLSSLSKGNKLTLLTKKHKQLKYWMSKGELKQGCELRPNKLILWVEVAKQKHKKGKSIGVDLGMVKLLTTNEGEFFGTKFNKINEKILRKKKNSKAYKKALRERDNLINQEVNKLPWEDIGTLCYENLLNLTKGKNKLRKNKRLRVKQQHWTYRKVISRILMKCEENRVRPVYVNPRNTSRTCPSCNYVDEANRKLEKFHCLTCGYKHDADIVGAMNILHKGLDWLGSLESPNSKSLNAIV